MLADELQGLIRSSQSHLPDAFRFWCQRINGLVNQKRGLTPSTTQRVARLFCIAPDFWLNLQLRWLLLKVQQSEQAELEQIRDLRSSRQTS